MVKSIKTNKDARDFARECFEKAHGKMPEIYEGLYVSDNSPVFHLSSAIKFEVTKEQMPIEILRIKRVYNKVPKVLYFKSPKKIKKYVPIRIIVEYL